MHFFFRINDRLELAASQIFMAYSPLNTPAKKTSANITLYMHPDTPTMVSGQ